MSYEGTIACGTLLAIAFFQLGRLAERRKCQKRSDAVHRINEKYRTARTR